MVHCMYRGVPGYNCKIKIVFPPLNFVFVLANSADLYEMVHHAAFHPGLHCLSKYTFRRH